MVINGNILKRIFLTAVLPVYILPALAQADPIEKLWYSEDKTAKIHIYKGRDGKFYGKIAWLKVPDRNGKPKIDEKNPDPKKRNQPILGLTILKGFTKGDDNEYEDGTIYDPKNGKSYSCKITRNNDILDVRGYVGISLIGRTSSWTVAD
jgi:uncharacterized protein (DUF2147 family)